MPRKSTVEEIMSKVWIPPRDLVTLGLAGSEKTVYNLVSAGRFPVASTKFGHRRLFKLDDVLACLKKNEVRPEAG
jgi:hypothetical protein